MRKDPTEFRERFRRWKEGEQVYEAGLPKYADGLTPYNKRDVNTNQALYNSEEDLYSPRYTLPEVTVTGTNKRPHTHAPIHLSKNAYKMLTEDLLGAMTTGSDIGDVLDVGKDLYNLNYTNAGIGAAMFAVPNIVEKPLRYLKRPVLNALYKVADKFPTTNLEKRGLEVLVRSTDGNDHGLSIAQLKLFYKADKSNFKNALNYIITGKGNVKSLRPKNNLYTGFRDTSTPSLPNVSYKDEKYGDIIDAILYEKPINPIYGVEEILDGPAEFGLTKQFSERYKRPLKHYKTSEKNLNTGSFGYPVSNNDIDKITDIEPVIVLPSTLDNSIRPNSMSVPVTHGIGADLGHYDLLRGLLNGEQVYRWQDIYEFKPSYFSTWDKKSMTEAGNSSLDLILRDIALKRLDKAHTPVILSRDWFHPVGFLPERFYGVYL